MVIIHGAIVWNVWPLIWKGYPDFTILYSAGTLVRRGMGHELYNEVTQFSVQQEFAPDVTIRSSALPYNHPPFEAAIFVPLTYLPYPVAFIIWSLANIAMLAAMPFFLRSYLPQFQIYSRALWILACVAFLPIFLVLLAGQDSILLLFLYTLTFICLKKGRDGAAGSWLALGLFKPHLVLPFGIFLLAQRRVRSLYGFLAVSVGLLLVSLRIVGFTGLILYPHYVMHLEEIMGRGAIMPSDMPNLRGLFYVLFCSDSGARLALWGSFLAMLLFTAWQCRETGSTKLFDLQFSLAVVATVLVSYHGMGYDLSVLMLPILLLTNQLSNGSNSKGWSGAAVLTAVAFLFCSPLELILWLRINRMALTACAILLLFFGIAGQIQLHTQKVRS